MTYTQRAVQDKILEMFPEISRNHILMSLRFEEDKDAWLIHLSKDGHDLDTHLDRKDADSCLSGIKCVSLGVKVDEFISNFGNA